MNIDSVEIIINGGIGGSAATVADHIALALMAAGATVDFPGRQQREVMSGRTLRDVHAVVRMASGEGRAALPVANRGGENLSAAVKVAVGVVLFLALCNAEVRLHFGLRLDVIITAVVIWGFWRWCLRGAAMTI